MLGWRTAFWGIAGVGAIAMISLRLALPPLPVEAGSDMASELRVVRRGPVLAALALTVLGASAMFTVFTYIVPILKVEAGASTVFVTAMLVVYGIGLTVGNWVGGRFADRSVDGTLIVSLLALIGLLAVFAIGMRWEASAAPLVFLWGVASFAVVPPLQMRVMEQASDAPNLASAMNIGAFNLGNAIGAALGGRRHRRWPRLSGDLRRRGRDGRCRAAPAASAAPARACDRVGCCGIAISTSKRLRSLGLEGSTEAALTRAGIERGNEAFSCHGLALMDEALICRHGSPDEEQP